MEISQEETGASSAPQKNLWSDKDFQLRTYRQTLNRFHATGRNKFLAKCPFHADEHPSLRIDDNKGPWLWRCDPCQTGGDIRKLLKELGRPLDTERPKCDQEADYIYSDATGQPIFKVLRRYEVRNGLRVKTFPQMHLKEGKWVSGGALAEQRTIYNLPAVLKAEQVLVLEGEKDVETAIALGFVATTNPMGAGKWQDNYSEPLRDKNVIIVPDADEPGERHAQKVYRSLQGKARSLKIVRLPGAKDFTEWVEHGGTTERFAQLIQEAPTEPDIPTDVQKTAHDFHLTDLGNAKQLAAAEGRDIRYCHTMKKWFVWDGQRWAKDETAEIERRAKKTVQQMLVTASRADDYEQRQRLVVHQQRSEAASRLRAMIELTQSEPGVPVRVTDFDCNRWQFNVSNGTLDLRTGKLQEHRREDFISKMSPVVYDSSANCPKWMKFLDDVTQTDSGLISYLQQCVGYTLTGETTEQKLFMLYGSGANGKSTFLEVVKFLLGDYAQTADPASFLVSKGQPIRNDLAKLHDARLVVATETESGRRLAESLIKQATGGETMTARFLYAEHFEFRPQWKLWLATNHRPVIYGTDEAIWRRIKLVPFTVYIPTEKRNPRLLEELKLEAAGILRWALEGLQTWQKSGLLKEPEMVNRATAEYRGDQDVLAHFLTDKCRLNDDATTKAATLYAAYGKWAEQNGERPLSAHRFSEALGERPELKKLRRAAGMIWTGLELLGDSENLPLV